MKGVAITILANNQSLMKMDGVSGEHSKVTAQANWQYLSHSAPIAGGEQVNHCLKAMVQVFQNVSWPPPNYFKYSN